MSLLYRLMYRIGVTPWDRVLPAELSDIVMGPDALPPGRALDLGSGQGAKAVFMAKHGWRVTAVENVPRALGEARRRAAQAGVEVDFRQGDVTRLAELRLQPGYSLVFDFGCYHGLNRKQRDAYGVGVNALASPGATMLLMGFTRAVPPVPVGVSEQDLAEHLGGGWRLSWTHPVASGGTSAMNRAAAAWFCLVRR
jgi:SAM-dependent methyltransferase